MHTLLIISPQPAFAASIEAALDASRYRIIAKDNATDASVLLAHSAVDAVILDLDHTERFASHAIEEIRAHSPQCSLIIYSAPGPRPWEEDAYILGVAHVLDKPVRARLLVTLLNRSLAETPAQIPAPVPVPPAASAHPVLNAPQRGLEELRRFSSLLVHSLNAHELLVDALQQLREALGTNRAVFFLRKVNAVNATGEPSFDDHWLRPAHSIGHDPALIEHFPLSLSAGLGRHLARHGRILRADSPDTRSSREIAREFQTLGSAVALPISDRQVLIGALLLDERITGGTFTDEELAQVFHWLEELGVAIRNCWRHEQLASTHGLIDDILAGIGSGCIVVGLNCGILHANESALRMLFPGRPDSKQLDFAEIPQQLGSLIFQVIQTGKPAAPFKWIPPAQTGTFCRVNILPFTVGATVRPNAALLILDDITEHENSVQLEMEAAKLRLVRQMAWHLAHEIGNAVTPVSTMQQLLDLQGDDEDVRKELSGVLGASVKRIMRLTQQMNFLSRDWDGKAGETVRIADLIEGAYTDANSCFTGKNKAGLIIDKAAAPWKVTGDTKALRHAFAEIILNALQANLENPRVTIRIGERTSGEHPEIEVELQDAGPGISDEVASKIGEPFHSTRSVGLGLGLTVSRKIIENHHGSIEIPRPDKSPGIVKVTLPIPPAGVN